jgi:hypothetical protein
MKKLLTITIIETDDGTLRSNVQTEERGTNLKDLLLIRHLVQDHLTKDIKRLFGGEKIKYNHKDDNKPFIIDDFKNREN